MDTNHLSEIKDAEKKLSAFRSQLDLLVRGIWESKNVNPSEVLAAVTELQSLVEWAAQQPDLGTEGVVLLVQLQELNKIRQNLEKTPADTTKPDVPDLKDEHETELLEGAESYSNELLDFSEIKIPNLSDDSVESNQEETSIIPSTYLPYFNASSSSTEDTTVAFIPNSDKLNETAETDGEDTVILKDIMETDKNIEGLYDKSTKFDIEVQELLSNTIQDIMKNDKEMKDEFYKDFEASIKPEIQDILLSDPEVILKHDDESKGMSLNDFKVSQEPSREMQEFLKSDPAIVSKSDDEIKDIDLSSGTEVLTESCTESKDMCCSTEVIAKPDSEIQDLTSGESKILPNNNTEIENLLSMEAVSTNPKSLRNEVIILETNEDEKTTEWINDPKCSKDPLDVCMFAIRNLYESLRAKENELLKLSVMQNDQKHIEALQGVIIDFHKDITNLNCELDKTKKENALLKEQVLELEEAENDARSEAQKLEQKLVFLQEKDSHSQAEICQLKQNFKKSIDKIVEKESSEKELRSQIKYMETLVQKYEDQIKVMEAKEITASKKDAEMIENSLKSGNMKFDKLASCERGTQTYPFQTKLNSQILQNSSSVESQDFDLTISQNSNIPNEIHVASCEKEAIKSVSQNSSISVSEETNIKEEISMGNIDSITQNELMKRLLKLVDEDEGLQQQIHHVDQINLTLWQKLQNLENNIGECKRKDINETDISISNNKPSVHNGGSDTKNENLSDIKENNNIPVDNLMSLDQSEEYIKDRLTKLEKINVTFEKELKTSQNLRKEKEKKYDEWVQTERRLTSVLKSLSEERNCLVDQVTNLKKEKEELEKRVLQQKTELSALKEKNQTEIVKLRTEQESMTLQLHHKVNELIAKEKELLKMITSLKSERNKNQDKRELERLKCNYIELQLELSNSREDIRKLEEEFKRRLDECISKHLQEESRRTAELERLRNEKARCDKMISELQLKQHHLVNALERQEKELKWARECYKKSLEDTEEVHRSVETELKNQLQQMEEGTVIATTALMEERKRVEKELQENIKDLRAKEELYKSKITELERDVSHLHEELSKVSEDSGLRIDAVMVQENSTEKLNGKINEPITTRSLTFDSHNGPHSVDNSYTSDADLRPLSRDSLVRPSKATVNQHQRCSKREATEIVGETENVDDLRAQVRELQTQLEKISVDTAEMPSGPAITAPSMGLQKEDIDYAEVDECVADWRKATQNLPAAKGFPLPFQTVYGDKYSTGYKNNVLNEISPAEKSDEENDYDEVLPRPTNFHVVQQVGSDTLLVGWNYVNPSVLDGYEVYLNNEVHERIYIPDRTKALISGLNLKRSLRLSICALSRYGQMSEPADLDISCPDTNERCFEDDGEDEYKDFEDSINRKQRPYSMEW